MNHFQVVAIAGLGIMAMTAPASAGLASVVAPNGSRPAPQVEQVRYRRNIVPEAVIGGLISGVLGGLVGGNCYYNDCGYDNGPYDGGEGYYGGGDGYYGGGYGGGGRGYRGGGRVHGFGGGRGGGVRMSHASIGGGHFGGGGHIGGGGGHGGGGHGGGGHGGGRK